MKYSVFSVGFFYGLFVYTFLVSSPLQAQDWRLLRHSHNPETCSTCQANLNSIGIDLPLWKGRVLENYFTSSSNFFDDYIIYRNPDGSNKTVAVKELSTFELPKKLTLNEGSKIDLVNLGAIDESTISIEGKYAPTPNQVVQKQVPLPLIRLSDISRGELSRMLGRFTINGSKCFGFVTGIDQRREYFTLRYGEYGIVRNFPYSSVNEGSILIDRLHRDHFFGIKRIGLNLFKMKEDVYFTLHRTSPIDYEAEIRKEEESLKQRALIAQQNLMIRQNYERDLANALRYGISRYSVLSPNYIDMPPLYLAHPKWSEIATVYKCVREYLEEEYYNWERSLRMLPSVPLKTPEEKNFDTRKKMAMGSETVEGYYKVKVNKGEFKLYILPNGAGRCVIKRNRARYRPNGEIDEIQRSHYECGFSYKLEKSRDLSIDLLRASSVKVKHSRNVGAISGSKLSDYLVQFKDGKIEVLDKRTGIKLSVERLRSVVVKPNQISAITPSPYALNPQEKVKLQDILKEEKPVSIEMQGVGNRLLDRNQLKFKVSQPVSLTYKNNEINNTIFVVLNRNLKFEKFLENERKIELQKLGIPQLIEPKSIDSFVFVKSGLITPGLSEELSFKAPSIPGEYQFFVSETPINKEVNFSTGVLRVYK